MRELSPSDEEIEIRVGRLEAQVLDMQQKVATLERACIHDLETRALLDRVSLRSGVPVGTTSEHWNDTSSGWEGGGA